MNSLQLAHREGNPDEESYNLPTTKSTQKQISATVYEIQKTFVDDAKSRKRPPCRGESARVDGVVDIFQASEAPGSLCFYVSI